MAFIFNRIIRQFGEDVQVKRRSISVDEDGKAIFSYPSTLTVRVMVSEAGAYRETWEEVGVWKDIDYLASASNDADIDLGDRIILPNGEELEVVQVVPRKRGKHLDYKELLLRRVGEE